MRDFTEIWSYLAAGPLVWLTATLVAYLLADALALKMAQFAARWTLANKAAAPTNSPAKVR